MASYTVKQTVVENLNADLDGKQPAGDYPTNASLTESLQSNLLNYTTNRILEIKQDIKLELNNGTLKLKAGSKLYKPNGFESDGTTPKFDEVNISVDKTGLEWFGTNTYDYIIFYEIGRIIDGTLPERCTSGTSYPSSPSNGDRCYRTDLNRLYVYRTISSSWVETDTLPLGIVRSSGTAGKVGSIDQVFNGFGYIGSTVFALPGVKCQFADGRNEDGSYKSYIKITDKILTKTFGAETFNGFDCSLVCRNDTIDGFAWHVNEDFDNKSGYIIINKTEGIVKNLCPVFRFFINSSSDNGRISQFIPNPVDKLNWKSTELSGFGMPSSRYIDLTLGASGTTYTAPANGWFYLNGICTSAGSYGYISNAVTGMRYTNQTFTSNTTMAGYLPCKKGDVIICDYSNFTKQYFRFIYAQGDQ